MKIKFGVMNIWKYIGETPLQAQERAIVIARDLHGINTDRVCYTNRLDPMAQGIITILFGDDVHKAPQYNSRDKVYKFQAILGISTESYDPLSYTTCAREVSTSEVDAFINGMMGLIGERRQVFPPCSAYVYKGRPLWKRHMDNTLPDIMPSKVVRIYDIKKVTDPTAISIGSYRSECFSDMDEVTSHGFNVPEIRRRWSLLDANMLLRRIEFQAHVSAGTYIRSLVHDTAKTLDIPAHAFRITRLQTLSY